MTHGKPASQTFAALTRVALAIITLVAFGLSSPGAHAQTYTEHTVHAFNGPNADGSYTFGNLVLVNGIFYGTTFYGGNNPNSGTIYSVHIDGTGYQILHSFSGGANDGANPQAGLVNVNGILYGTTAGGGSSANNGHGFGTIFSIHTDGTGFQILHSFSSGANDGAAPLAGMINVNGILYGTTANGGSSTNSGFGTVFSVDPATKTETILHTFTDTNGDGGRPQASLLNVNGVLYGTTVYGSVYSSQSVPHGFGTIFSISTDGTGYQIVHSFSGSGGAHDGAVPETGLINVNGILYGTTEQGGYSNSSVYDLGTIYSLDPSTNVETVLYSFQGYFKDGVYPGTDLLNMNGTLYGTISGSGSRYAYPEGGVFSFDPTTGIERVIYSFDYNANNATLSQDGDDPVSALIAVNGTFYGTMRGGGMYGYGKVFSLTPAPPIAKDDAGRTYYDNALIISTPGVLANDNNNGAPMTAVLVTNPSHGTLTFNSNGGFTYVPNDGYIGTDSFTYQAVSTIGASNIATCTLTIQQALPPTADDDSNRTYYNTTLTVAAPGVLGNDDIGHDPHCKAVLVTNPSAGTLTLQSDGSYVYVPNTGFVGTDSFTYKDTNAVGTSNTATVRLTVVPEAPTANNDAYTVRYNNQLAVAPAGVLANDLNNGDPYFSAALVTNPSHGTLAFGDDGGFKYTPDTGFAGTDSFTYQAVDYIGKSNIATVTLTIQKTVPTANNDSARTAYNTTLTIAAPGVLGNDSNADTSTMTAALVTGPTHGTITFNSDGSFKYTPTSGFLGTDSFTYQAVNALGASNTATCTLQVQARTPIANNDNGRTYYGQTLVIAAPGVLANDSNGNTGTMTATLASQPSHGTISFHSDGSFTYVPVAGYIGYDSFTYYDTNSVGKSNTATCTLQVQARSPIAYDDHGRVQHNTTLVISAPGVLTNDYNGGSAAFANLLTNPSHGTITFHIDGSFTYVPVTGFIGTDSFTYNDTNAIGTSNTATCTLTVQ